MSELTISDTSQECLSPSLVMHIVSNYFWQSYGPLMAIDLINFTLNVWGLFWKMKSIQILTTMFIICHDNDHDKSTRYHIFLSSFYIQYNKYYIKTNCFRSFKNFIYLYSEGDKETHKKETFENISKTYIIQTWKKRV